MSNRFPKKILSKLLALVLVFLTLFGQFSFASAAFNQQINYQGKLLGTTGSSVSDGTYAMTFKLYTASSGGSPIWTEARTGANEVQVTSGLFSVMLGSVTSLSGVDFDQSLWLGVTIESDSEMTPRKSLGAVPAAFVADKATYLGSASSTQYLRSDTVGVLSVSSASTGLIINQAGAGDIINLQDNGTEVFTVIDGGNVGIGTTTPNAKLSVRGSGTGTGRSFSISNSSNVEKFSVLDDGTVNFSNTLNVGTNGISATNYSVGADGSATFANGNFEIFATGALTAGDISVGTITGTGDFIDLSAHVAGNINTSYSVKSGGGLATMSDLGLFLAANGASGAGNLAYSFTNDTDTGLYRSASDEMRFQTGGSDRITISSAGNVGIGTTTPSAKFAITGTAGTGDIFAIASSTNARLITVTSDGSLGIGTSTTQGYALSMVAPTTSAVRITRAGFTNSIFNVDITGSGPYLGMTGSGGAVLIRSYNSAGVGGYISNGANFGFGTTTPSASLAVTGVAGTGDVFALASSTNARLLTVKSTGRVGIGTASPSSTFSVTGLAGSTDIFSLASSTDTQLLTFTSTGRLGIGTSNPSAAFEVAGNIALSDGANRTISIPGTGTYELTISGQANTGSGYGGNVNLAGGSADNVGGSVNIYGGESFQNAGPGNVYIRGGTNSYFTGSGGSVYLYGGTGPSANGNVVLGMNSSDTPTGKVGVGTTTPAYLLSVAGDADITGALRFSGNAGTSGYVLQSTGASAQWVATSTLGITASLSGGTDGYVTRWTGASSVSTGIMLDNGTVAGVRATSSLYTFNVQGASGVHPFNVASSTGTSLLTVTSAGNVGIGTTTPGSKLDLFANSVSGGNILRFSGLPASINDLITPYRDNGTAGWKLQAAGGGQEFFRVADSGGTARLVMDTGSAGTTYFNSTGNFGLGTTTPVAKLAVTGTAGTGDIFAFASSTNSQYLTLKSTGRLGLGTVSPTALLDIVGSTASLVPLRIQNPSSSSNYSFLIEDPDGTDVLYHNTAGGTASVLQVTSTTTKYFKMESYESDNNYFTAAGATFSIRTAGGGYNIAFFTDTSTGRAVISGSTGHLVVGTTAQNGSARVHSIWTGGAQFRSEYDSSNYATITTGSTGTTVFDTNGTANTFSFSDNVGIGTTTPIEKLQVHAATGQVSAGIRTSFTDATSYGEWNVTENGSYKGGLAIFGSNYTTATWRDAMVISSVTNNTGSVIFRTRTSGNYAERMIVTNAGKVGIGTTTPTALLDLLSTTEQVRVGYDALNYYTTTVGSTGLVTFNAVGSGSAFHFTDSISTDGLVRLDGSAGNDYIWHSGSNKVHIATAGFDRLTVDGSGNVGVGTTTPAYLLSVAGDADITGALRFSGNAGTSGYVLQSTGASAQWVATSTLGITGGSGSPGGSDTYVQFNDGGVFGGDAGFLYNKTLDVLTVTNASTTALTASGAATLGYLKVTAVTEQSRVGYDASNYLTTTVAADGAVTFDAVGTDPEFNFSDNVGINTVSPSTELEIYGSNGGAANIYLTRNDSTTVTGDELGGIAWGSTDGPSPNAAAINAYATENFSASAAGTYMTFRTSAAGGDTITEQMRITDAGNVGIGTTSPQRKLHVRTTADEAPVRFEDTNGYCEINPTSTTWTCTSDERLKENIRDLVMPQGTAGAEQKALERLAQLRPVNFEWKNDDNDQDRTGLIAQEVEKIFPDLVQTDENGYKSVSYGGFTIYIIQAMKEVLARIDSLEQFVTNGAGQVTAAVVDTFERLKVGSSDKPTGITLYDEETGEPYCLKIKGGETKTTPGECEIVDRTAQNEPPVPTPEPQPGQEGAGEETDPGTGSTGEPQPGTDEESAPTGDQGQTGSGGESEAAGGANTSGSAGESAPAGSATGNSSSATTNNAGSTAGPASSGDSSTTSSSGSSGDSSSSASSSGDSGSADSGGTSPGSGDSGASGPGSGGGSSGGSAGSEV